MRPEGCIQTDRLMSCLLLNIIRCVFEDTHLCLSEAVNTLFRIPDHKQTGTLRWSESVDDLLLDQIGILKFIHHQVLNAVQKSL